MIITTWFDFEGETYVLEVEGQSWSVRYLKDKRFLTTKESERKGFYEAVIEAKHKSHMTTEVVPIASEPNIEFSNAPLIEMLAEMSTEISLEASLQEEMEMVKSE